MKQRQTQNKPRRNIDGGLEKVATKIEKLKMYPSDLPCQKNGNTDKEKKKESVFAAHRKQLRYVLKCRNSINDI